MTAVTGAAYVTENYAQDALEAVANEGVGEGVGRVMAREKEKNSCIDGHMVRVCRQISRQCLQRENAATCFFVAFIFTWRLELLWIECCLLECCPFPLFFRSNEIENLLS